MVVQVVFKALIVLHTMIRNGATDNVLTYLSTDDVLKLKNVSTGQWEGAHVFVVDAEEFLTGVSAQVTARLRACKTTLHISTFGYEHTET